MQFPGNRPNPDQVRLGFQRCDDIQSPGSGWFEERPFLSILIMFLAGMLVGKHQTRKVIFLQIRQIGERPRSIIAMLYLSAMIR